MRLEREIEGLDASEGWSSRRGHEAASVRVDSKLPSAVGDGMMARTNFCRPRLRLTAAHLAESCRGRRREDCGIQDKDKEGTKPGTVHTHREVTLDTQSVRKGGRPLRLVNVIDDLFSVLSVTGGQRG